MTDPNITVTISYPDWAYELRAERPISIKYPAWLLPASVLSDGVHPTDEQMRRAADAVLDSWRKEYHAGHHV